MAKRVKGEGSWSYPKSGGVRLKVMYNGKTKYFYGQTEQVCLDKKLDYESLRKQGFDSDGGVTVERFITNWMNNVKKRKLKKRSFDRLESTVNTWVIPRLGDYKFDKLEAIDIQIELINYMQDRGKSLSSIKKAKDALNGAYVYALTTRAVSYNPVGAVELPNASEFPESEMVVFDSEERERFCKAATSMCQTGNPRYVLGQLFVLLLYTGCRAGEILALKWSDVNLEKRTIAIRHTIICTKNRNWKNGERRWIHEDQPLPKGNRSRIVHLNDMAYDALINLKCQFVKTPNGYVAHTKDNKFYTFEQLDSTYKKILARAELQKCGIHTLRHSCATMLFEAGIPIQTISDILGHASVEITSRVYVHIIERLKAEAMNEIDNVI